MNEMLIARILLAVVLIGSGVALSWMARAAASGRLQRNQVAGIRTPATLSSDEAWLVAHRRAERPTWCAGACAVVTGLLALVPGRFELLMLIVGVGSLVMLGLVLYGAKVGTDAARAIGARPGPGGHASGDGASAAPH